MAEVEINYLQNNQPNGKDQENQYNIQGLAYQNKSAHEVEAQRGKILLKREKAAGNKNKDYIFIYLHKFTYIYLT